MELVLVLRVPLLGFRIKILYLLLVLFLIFLQLFGVLRVLSLVIIESSKVFGFCRLFELRDFDFLFVKSLHDLETDSFDHLLRCILGLDAFRHDLAVLFDRKRVP